MSDALTRAQLRQRLEYQGATGQFVWKIGVRKGSIAGCLDTKGHRQIKVMGRAYLAHRLAWLYCFGHFPLLQIDHINGNKDDNRIKNLRDVSGAINAQNRRTALINSKTGILGVSPFRNKWRADIRVNGRLLPLGHFESVEDARAAYVAAKRRFHPGCTI